MSGKQKSKNRLGTTINDDAGPKQGAQKIQKSLREGE
jgi:hypothetical protein